MMSLFEKLSKELSPRENRVTTPKKGKY